jgi:pimeloyl-ACP methyl ester carboxylesterase
MEPFSIDVDQTVLDDLRERLRRARWTDDFANDDWRYGASVGDIRELADYWLHRYDWRARETLMNRFSHWRTDIAGMPIHFIHQRGRGPRPIPLILSHGWPWSFWDFYKIIGPLSDPEAHGGDAADAFDVVVPSLPGYTFSTPLRTTGINWWKTADLWVQLMERLGYPRFAAQGGDWGAFISAQLGHKYPQQIIGIHIHTVSPLDFLAGGKFDPADYAPEEQPHLAVMREFAANEYGYMALQRTKPQTPAVALADSPVGLLAWIVEKRRRWSDCHGQVQRRFTRDELIDTVMLYWVTNCYHTSARYYYEGAHDLWRPSHPRMPVVEAPVAIPFFPAELTKPARRWAERYYNLQRWTVMPAGGHFAAMEEPEALVADIRAFFRDRR